MHMRVHFKNAIKVVMCCAVLHNICITWWDDMDELQEVEDWSPPDDTIAEYEVAPNYLLKFCYPL